MQTDHCHSSVSGSIVTKFSGSQQSQLAQIGAFLREKREEQGKSLQDIAVSTYIRPQLLSGIETGNPDLLPEPIFVQGFIRRYAETLGLKGVELSQQFTVDSIPSTPRPAKASEPEDSSTTRLTRFNSEPAPQQPLTDTATADEVPVFAAENATLSEEHLVTATPVSESDAFISDPFVSAPLALDPLELDLPAPEASEDVPVVLANSEPFNASNSSDLTNGSDAILSESSLSEQSASNSAQNGLSENGLGKNDLGENGLSKSGLDENGLSKNGSGENGLSKNGLGENGAGENGAGQLPVFETASAEFETPAHESSSEEPIAFVSDLPLAKKTPADSQITTSPISYTSTEPLSADTSSSVDTPNLKPFAIGAVIVAVLTAGIVVLASVLGRDPAPTAVSSSDPVESVEPVETEPALPTIPAEPEPAPPASDAPLFLEVEVTAPAWTSVVADGGERLFEGTLNPGDSVIWEAQNSITVFSGNPGGLSISQNGQPAEPLGENGIPSGKDYSVQ